MHLCVVGEKYCICFAVLREVSDIFNELPFIILEYVFSAVEKAGYPELDDVTRWAAFITATSPPPPHLHHLTIGDFTGVALEFPLLNGKGIFGVTITIGLLRILS